MHKLPTKKTIERELKLNIKASNDSLASKSIFLLQIFLENWVDPSISFE